jgi:predicted RNA-binding Zn-ribbon protein involved in translation (DUF1610 family)
MCAFGPIYQFGTGSRMIQFNCPHCHNTIKARDEVAGQVGKCSKCGMRVTIPQ